MDERLSRLESSPESTMVLETDLGIGENAKRISALEHRFSGELVRLNADLTRVKSGLDAAWVGRD